MKPSRRAVKAVGMRVLQLPLELRKDLKDLSDLNDASCIRFGIFLLLSVSSFY